MPDHLPQHLGFAPTVHADLRHPPARRHARSPAAMFRPAQLGLCLALFSTPSSCAHSVPAPAVSEPCPLDLGSRSSEGGPAIKQYTISGDGAVLYLTDLPVGFFVKLVAWDCALAGSDNGARTFGTTSSPSFERDLNSCPGHSVAVGVLLPYDHSSTENDVWYCTPSAVLSPLEGPMGSVFVTIVPGMPVIASGPLHFGMTLPVQLP
jgi:hypothetical protein